LNIRRKELQAKKKPRTLRGRKQAAGLSSKYHTGKDLGKGSRQDPKPEKLEQAEDKKERKEKRKFVEAKKKKIER